jgi:hypothetical protein
MRLLEEGVPLSLLIDLLHGDPGSEEINARERPSDPGAFIPAL